MRGINHRISTGADDDSNALPVSRDVDMLEQQAVAAVRLQGQGNGAPMFFDPLHAAELARQEAFQGALSDDEDEN